MSDQTPPDEPAEKTATDTTTNDDGSDTHIITKTGIAQYKTTFTYDEKEGDLVVEDTEMMDTADVSDPYWTCNCGEDFAGYPGAITHVQLYADPDEEVRNIPPK